MESYRLPRSRRRSLRRPLIAVLVVAAAAAIAAAVVGGIWVSRYAPLEWSGTGSYGPGQAKLTRVVEPATGSGGKVVYFPHYRRGGAFSFGFDLTNSGPLAVRLSGLDEDDAYASAAALRLTGLGLAPNPNASTVDGAVPFHPVTVEPGQSVWLVVHLRMSCKHMSRGAEESLVQMPLRYSYLKFFHRSQWVEPPVAVTLAC